MIFSKEIDGKVDGMKGRVRVEEQINKSNNSSTFKIYVDVMGDWWYGYTYYLDGYINLNDSRVVTFKSFQGTNSVTTKALDTWYTVSGSPFSITLQHDSSGNLGLDLDINFAGFSTDSSDHGNGFRCESYNNYFNATHIDQQPITPTYGYPSTPGNFSCTSSVYKNGTFQLSWNAASDGTNNPITKYRVYWGINQEGNSYYKDFGKNLSGSISVSETRAGKGDSVYFQIRAIGTVDGYNSAFSNAIIGKIVNRPPSAPSFTTNGVISNSGETQIQINNLSANDDDGDSLSYYYRVNSSSSSGSPSNSGISSGSYVTMSSSNHYIHIWAYDGTSYSSVSTRDISVNSGPQIIDIAYSGERYGGTGGYAYKTLSASANVTKQGVSYTWTINGKTVSYESTFNNINLRSYFSEGSSLSIGLTISDGVDSASKTVTVNGYVLKSIGSLSSNLFVTNGDGKTDLPNYFNQKINVRFGLPSYSSNGNVPMLKYVISTTDNSWSVEGSLSDYGSSALYSNTFQIDTTYGSQKTFKVIITDIAGQTVEQTYGTSLARLNILNITNLQIDDINWKYIDDNTFSFSTNWSSVIPGGIKYILETSLNGGAFKNFRVITVNQNGGASIEGYLGSEESCSGRNSTIYYTYSGGSNSTQLYEKTGGAVDNSIKTVVYRIVAENAFGQRGTAKTVSGTVDGRSAPFFSSNTALQLRRGYCDSDSLSGVSLKSNLISSGSSPLERYINPREVIQICLTDTPQDKNGDSLQLNISYAFGSSMPSYSSSSWIHLATVNVSSLSSTSISGTTYYTYNLLWPYKGTIGKFFIKVYAIDNTGLKTPSIGCQNYLLNSRKKDPLASITSFSLDKQNINIGLKFSDFGGNDKGFQNFIREDNPKVTDNDSKITFYVSYSKNQDMTFAESFSSVSQALNSDQGADRTLNFGIAELPFFSSLGNRTYFQIKIVIQTNPKDNTYNNISYTLPIYTYYKESATLSYRKHWIGINSFEADKKADDLLYISSTQGRKKITLAGSNIVTIDLETGKITGATFDGGTW